MCFYRGKPSRGTGKVMASIDTGAAFADPTTNPRTWQTTAISPNTAYSANNTYLDVIITDDTELLLYGVTVYYRVGT
jgi:hypothetical protein